jgi:hypothetical protein
MKRRLAVQIVDSHKDITGFKRDSKPRPFLQVSVVLRNAQARFRVVLLVVQLHGFPKDAAHEAAARCRCGQSIVRVVEERVGATVFEPPA